MKFMYIQTIIKLFIERELIFTHWIWMLGTDTGRVAMLAHLRPLHAQKFRYTNGRNQQKPKNK